MSAASVAAPVEPELTAEERLLLATGLAQFNDRLFFESHDTLEEAWSGLRGAPRDFFQGLIQAADQALYQAKAAGRNQLCERSISYADVLALQG